MTARLYIIRGTFILLWGFYQYIGETIQNYPAANVSIDPLTIYGIISLVMGITLMVTSKDKIKLEIALVISLIGLLIGISGIYNSYNLFTHTALSTEKIIEAFIALSFGLLITMLYIKSLREIQFDLKKKK